MDFGIKYIDYYIPGNFITTEGFIDCLNDDNIPGAFAGKEAYKEFAKTVLQVQRIPVENRFDEFNMLAGLLDKMFDEQIIDPLDVDLIVLIDEHGYGRQANMVQLIQYKFGMVNASVLSISGNHCANFDIVVSTFSKLYSERIKNIIVLNATVTRRPEKRVIASYGILGDAAGLLLLSREDTSLSVINSSVFINGRLHQAELEKDNSMLHTKYLLKCIKEVTEGNLATVDSLKKVVIQNANPMLNAHVLNYAGISADKVFSENLGRYGHLDCLDFIVNLHQVCRQVAPGDAILSLGMGWAGSYAAILFSKN